ncbi:MAG: ABC transporter ATP-binding protein [Gammaproteobacteria bacterium]
MNAPAANILSADALRLTTGGVALLDGVDVQMRAGEVLGIVGPNGAGKSTLLKVLAGVLQPDSGNVLLEGSSLAAHPPQARARKLAYLEQRPHVYWPLQVEQVVALGRLPHGDADTPQAQQAIDAALRATATDKLRTRSFHTLSEGERVRVHLARVLACEPRIVLADEPVAALDPWHQLHVLELLRIEAARGTTIALVLHDLQHAARHCERLLVLDGGTVRACGRPVDVLNAALLAEVWRVEATVDSATLSVTIHGRK